MSDHYATIQDGIARHQAAEKARAFIPEAAKVWANLSDRPWNRLAMEAVLTEFALRQAEGKA